MGSHPAQTRLSDWLLILRKPFDRAEVSQVALALTSKWALKEAERHRHDELEAAVLARTSELAEAHRRLTEETKHRENMEEERRLTRRLEAIGQLAAGIAHEINTPAQYVGDNLEFLQRLRRLDRSHRPGLAHGGGGAAAAPERGAGDGERPRVPLGTNPAGVAAALEGLDRIAKIVRP